MCRDPPTPNDVSLGVVHDTPRITPERRLSPCPHHPATASTCTRSSTASARPSRHAPDTPAAARAAATSAPRCWSSSPTSPCTATSSSRPSRPLGRHLEAEPRVDLPDAPAARRRGTRQRGAGGRAQGLLADGCRQVAAAEFTSAPHPSDARRGLDSERAALPKAGAKLAQAIGQVAPRHPRAERPRGRDGR